MKIAVWYHCLIAGPRISLPDEALGIVAEQMAELQESGLAEAATEIHVGVNGGDGEALTVAALAPNKAALHVNHHGQTELATLALLRAWLRPSWAVFYHHIKGVQHPPGAAFHHWRRNMQGICVGRWRECVGFLAQGYDTCGAHWFTPDRGALPGQRYWPGNFWWSTSDYLMGLPPLPPDRFERRYDAEDWIGKSVRPPRWKDLWRNMPLG